MQRNSTGIKAAFSVLIALFVTVACVLFILLMATASHAKTAEWSTVGNWKIVGNSESRYCGAVVIYKNDQALLINFYDGEVSLSINGLNVDPGARYKAIVRVSTGRSGTLMATAISDDAISFFNLGESVVKDLMLSKYITIKGVGSFDLTGSKAAMASAWECYKALNSY